ncbi:MAG: Rieske 2Fe-2S domain-containing protein [Verrucomicrobiota bacterium]
MSGEPFPEKLAASISEMLRLGLTDCPVKLEWHKPLPLEGWFLAARSHELKPCGVIGFDLQDQPLVIFRGEDGTPRTVPAHCPHMGAHLQHGTVKGNALQCPLHHKRFEASSPTHAPDHPLCLPALPTREAYGGVWVRACDPREPTPFPIFDGVGEEMLHFKHGRPVLVRCPWQAVVANAFDLNHFQKVHERALYGTPNITDHGQHIVFRYVSKVTGSSLPDRMMRLLSGNRIDVTICWHGSVLTVRTRTRYRETFLWLSFIPVTDGTLVKPVYAVLRGRIPLLSWLRVQVAGWLFHAFLRKDIIILERMRFAPSVTPEEDPCLNTFLRFTERKIFDEFHEAPSSQPNQP